jgi:DNA-directed RNA polymerase beta subunit
LVDGADETGGGEENRNDENNSRKRKIKARYRILMVDESWQESEVSPLPDVNNVLDVLECCRVGPEGLLRERELHNVFKLI